MLACLSYYKAFKNQNFITSGQYFNHKKKKGDIYLLKCLCTDEKEKTPYVTDPSLGFDEPAWATGVVTGREAWPEQKLLYSHHCQVEMNHPAHWPGLASL